MKKILFAALAALAITSCSQNEEIEAPSQKTPISFKTVVGKASRATPMLDTNFKNFKVYAYNTGKTEIASVTNIGTTQFMNGVNVEKTGTPESWTIDGTYYWPTTANVQFFAYSPMASTALTGWTATGQFPSFSYTVNEVTTQEDLLVAQATNKTKSAVTDDGVTLTFKHILTQINFSAKGETDDYTYTITSIKIGEVNQTNTYTFAGTDTPTGTWGTASNPLTGADNYYIYGGDYTKTINSSTTSVDLSKADGALLLLPQTLPDNAIIAINYSVKDTNKNEIFNGNAEVSLKGETWGVGSKINYILNLSNNGKEVKFKPTVSAWTEPALEPEKETPEKTQTPTT